MATLPSLSTPVHCDRFPSDDDFFVRENGVYPDEAPELPDSDYFEPTADDLEWLLSQRRDCRDLPATRVELDRRIASVCRYLMPRDVADAIAADRRRW